MTAIMDVLQLSGGIILCAGYLPQIRRILTTRSAHDLSLAMWLSVLTGLVLMEIYAVHLFLTAGTRALLITNSASLAFSIVMVGLILTYGVRPTLLVRPAPERLRRAPTDAVGQTVQRVEQAA